MPVAPNTFPSRLVVVCAFSADIEDAQDEDHEQEAAQADQEEAGQLSHGRDRVRQPLA